MINLEFDSETMGLGDAAKFLLVSKDTLMDMARAGTIPACKVGRRWVFMKSLLMEYVRRRSLREPNGPAPSSTAVQALIARREQWEREKHRRSKYRK
jgi:excisionase family DNA binding protein